MFMSLIQTHRLLDNLPATSIADAHESSARSPYSGARRDREMKRPSVFVGSRARRINSAGRLKIE